MIAWLISRLALGVLIAVGASGPASASPHCGEERAAVKLGLDSEAPSIKLAPVDITIAELVALPRPRKTPESQRAGNVERTMYRITATVIAYKLEDDGDVHLVVDDGLGHHMIVEIPSPDCAATGAWAEEIGQARTASAGRLRPDRKLRAVRIPGVSITGVGFFDKLHGQDGVAANGIELHPVLAIDLGGGS